MSKPRITIGVPVELRFYAIRFDVTDQFNIEAFNAPKRWPVPSRITCYAACTPDVATHLCSAQPMLWIEPIGYDAEWDGEIQDNLLSAMQDWWSTMLGDADRDPDYYTYGRFVSMVDGEPYFSCRNAFVEAVEVDDANGSVPDDIMEKLQANHLL